MYRYLLEVYYNIQKKRRERYISNLVKKGMHLGKNVSIIDNFFFDPSHCFLISIGDNCIICPNVRLIAHDASTKNILGYTKIGRISIKNNCFIGDSAIVLPNVTIGPNSIIGAGSVVKKDVPPDTVVAGNPARVISSIKDYIKKVEAVSKNKNIFTGDYHVENIDENKRKEMINSLSNSPGFII